MDNNLNFESMQFEKGPEEPLVNFNFAVEHKFECGSSWPYIVTGAMSKKDREAYKKWKAAHSKK